MSKNKLILPVSVNLAEPDDKEVLNMRCACVGSKGTVIIYVSSINYKDKPLSSVVISNQYDTTQVILNEKEKQLLIEALNKI